MFNTQSLRIYDRFLGMGAIGDLLDIERAALIQVRYLTGGIFLYGGNFFARTVLMLTGCGVEGFFLNRFYRT